jgi:hypothetical protein
VRKTEDVAVKAPPDGISIPMTGRSTQRDDWRPAWRPFSITIEWRLAALQLSNSVQAQIEPTYSGVDESLFDRSGLRWQDHNWR